MTIDAAEHVGLALYYARRYGARAPDPEAVVEIAFLSLLRAARGFDPSRGPWPAFAAASLAMAVRGEVARQFREPQGEPLRFTGEDGQEEERRDLPHCPPVGTARLESEAIREAVLLLPPRQARVVALHFGLEDGQARTLEEIGSLLGVGPARVRQLEQAALRKLRWILSRRRAAGFRRARGA